MGKGLGIILLVIGLFIIIAGYIYSGLLGFEIISSNRIAIGAIIAGIGLLMAIFSKPKYPPRY